MCVQDFFCFLDEHYFSGVSLGTWGNMFKVVHVDGMHSQPGILSALNRAFDNIQ